MTPTSDLRAPSSRAMIHAWLLLLAVVGLVLFWFTSTVWFAVFLAVCFTSTLAGLARWCSEKTPLSYGWSLLAIVVMLVLIVSGAGTWMGPPVVAQTQELTQRLPEAVDQSRQWLEQREWGATLLEIPRQWSGDLGGSQVLDRLTWVVSSTMGAAAGILAVIAITLFLAVNPGMYIDGIISLVSKSRERRAREVLDKVGVALRWWLLGRLVSMAIVAVFTGLGLWLIGVPLPWTLGLIAGVLSFVPNLGPLVSMVPGLLLAGTEGGSTIVWALMVYVGVQLVESNLITPMVQRYAVSVPPALLLSLQLMMGVVFGVMGLIVATPLMVAGIVAVQMLYVQDRLGRDVAVMGQHDDDS